MIESYCYSSKPQPALKQCVCFLNGIFDPQGLLIERVKTANQVIAVDGGLLVCDRLGITPHLIIGDFDSAPKELLQKYHHIPQKNFASDKNDTDLQCALQSIDWEMVENVNILGWKGRADHFLGNIAASIAYPRKVLLDSYEEMLIPLSQGMHVNIPTTPGQIISIYPLFDSAVVQSKGLKWELQVNRPLRAQFFSQSNEALGDSVSIDLVLGSAICIIQKPDGG